MLIFKINQYIIGTPEIIRFLIIVISFIFTYHFFTFYISKPHKKKILFWQIVLYFVFVISGYYILQKCYSVEFEYIFDTIYMQRIYEMFWIPFLNQTVFPSILLTLTVFVFKKYLILKISPKKILKHGPQFTATSNNNGIVIGLFDRTVLPEHIRNFSSYSTKPLVLPFNRLSRGITILGDMGCGKSRLMKLIQDGIRKQYPKIPILIHDPKGEWLRTCYNPETDIIFAPYDDRSNAWRLWEDFKIHPELRYSVISTAIESHISGSNSDRFWSDSAISLLKDIIMSPTIDIAKTSLIKRKEAFANDKTFLSVYATAIIGFRDMVTVELHSHNTPDTETINEFLEFPGRIFLLNNPCCSAEQHGALTLLLSAFLLQSISLPDVAENKLRAAVFIDEALTFHLPADIERSVYSQSRSKGLCIVASAQRLPNKNHGERGMWAGQAAHIFGMRVTDMETRNSFSQRLGGMIYDEQQQSVSHGKESSTKTNSEVQRNHPALAPEDFGKLKNREFILFHETGVAPGKVIEVTGEQTEDIMPIEYTEREDVIKFMRKL